MPEIDFLEYEDEAEEPSYWRWVRVGILLALSGLMLWQGLAGFIEHPVLWESGIR
jgi:hypothetical protein